MSTSHTSFFPVLPSASSSGPPVSSTVVAVSSATTHFYLLIVTRQQVRLCRLASAPVTLRLCPLAPTPYIATCGTSSTAAIASLWIELYIGARLIFYRFCHPHQGRSR